MATTCMIPISLVVKFCPTICIFLIMIIMKFQTEYGCSAVIMSIFDKVNDVFIVDAFKNVFQRRSS